VESTERPDEKDDREGYTDQPEQKTSTHHFLLFAGFSNVVSELKFPARRQVCRSRGLYGCRPPAKEGPGKEGEHGPTEARRSVLASITNSFFAYRIPANSPCCARVASGQAAAAPPSSVMNSRRFIRSPRRRAPQPPAASGEVISIAPGGVAGKKP
jgi:hypothetical protein